MGELRQRGRIWWIRYYRNGKRYEESSHSAKKQTAIDLLKGKEGDISRGVPVTSQHARMTFDDAAADLLTEYAVNGRRSIGGVTRRVNLGLRPFFGGRRLAAIDTSHVNAFVADRQQAGAANATINRELAALKRMYTLARRAGKIAHVPYIPMLQEDNARQGFFELEQFESVRRHLPAALRPVVAFAFLTSRCAADARMPMDTAPATAAADSSALTAVA